MSALPLIDYGAILTGGAARRMGGSKADVRINGVMLVELTLRAISPACSKIVCIGGKPYLEHLGIPTVPDLFPGADSLGGIGTALKHALDNLGPDAWVLCVGCDMPLINPQVLHLLNSKRTGSDIVVPHVGVGFEPFCAIYRAGLFELVENQINTGNLRVRDLFSKARATVVNADELRLADPNLTSFYNVNSPSDIPSANALMPKDIT